MGDAPTKEQQADIDLIVTRLNDVDLPLTAEEAQTARDPAIDMQISASAIALSQYTREVADIITKAQGNGLQFHPEPMDNFFPNYGHEGKTVYVSEDNNTALEFHDRNNNNHPDFVTVWHSTDGRQFDRYEVSARFLEEELPNSGLPRTMTEISKEGPSR